MEHTSNNFVWNKKTILAILAFLLLLLTIPLAVYLVKKQTTLRSKAAFDPSIPQTGFELRLSQNQVVPGTILKADLIVHSDIDSANLFVAKIKFPAGSLKLESLTPLIAFDQDQFNTALNSRSGDDLYEAGFDANCDGAVTEDDRSKLIKTFVKEWVFNNTQDNVISLIGAVPNPGFKTNVGDGGLAACMSFKVLGGGDQEQDVKLEFDTDSKVYQNSDNVAITPQFSQNTLRIAPSVTGVTGEETITYRLVRGWNLIGMPVIPNFTVGKLLEKTNGKCNEVYYSGPDGQLVNFLNNTLRRIIFRRGLEEVVSGRGYDIKCQDNVTLAISGKPLTEIPDIKNNNLQMISLPFGRNSTALDLLNELSNNKRDCQRLAKRSTPDATRYEPVYIKGGTEVASFPINFKEGYLIQCEMIGTQGQPPPRQQLTFQGFLQTFRRETGDPLYNSNYDVNRSNKVDLVDFGILIREGKLR